jgi:hypothetical protein
MNATVIYDRIDHDADARRAAASARPRTDHEPPDE